MLFVGDDQHEWFSDDVQPSVAVFCGNEVANLAITEEEISKNLAAGRLIDPLGYHPAHDATYPVERDLALHIIGESIQEGFDVAACMAQPKDGTRLKNLGPAYAFVSRRNLRHRPRPGRKRDVQGKR